MSKIKILCKICNSSFEDYKSNKRVCCSRKCANKLVGMVSTGKSYVKGMHWKVKDTTKYRGRKLSEETKKKIGETRTGEKHWNWKGGTSRAYKDGYYSVAYKNWRIKVFERDGFMCQNCNQIGGYLTAHHIKSFRFYPELRFVLDNGITLCKECHKLTDNYGGNKKK